MLYLSVRLAGILATIVYAFAFLIGLTAIPTTILLLGPSMPKFLGGILGKLHFILGQLAFGTGYLVQREDRWELCPGTTSSVYIDGEDHEIPDGTSNLNVLGWQPFGILRFKDDDSLQRLRVGRGGVSADGGRATRAGFDEASPFDSREHLERTEQELRRLGVDIDLDDGGGGWWIDLKRVYARGVRHIGDIDIIEAAEQIMMRKTAKAGRVSGYETYIATFVGIVLGVLTAYVLLGG